VVGLLGPNGAGKTTLMQLIATITRPTDGQIRFQGVDILKEPETLRRQLGYLPQDFGVYDNLTAFEFLSYFGGLKGVTSRGRIDELLELVNLHTVAHRPAATFSGGMRQRLGIAQALLNDPALLIVDEPTAGLDPEERVRFRHLLSDLGHGKLVLLSTHIVSDIESLADTIAVMREGRLVTCAAPEALLQSARGQVWEAVVPSADYEAARGRLKVTRAVRQTDGVHARVVSRAQPFPTAQSVEPDLEDAFVHLMQVGA
jgi:ABC-type multidrug transport system ATPase subunit